MKKAQKEFAEKTGSVGVKQTSADGNQTESRSYRLDGTPSNGKSKGIHVKKGKKTLVR
jgi:hypothetical protein